MFEVWDLKMKNRNIKLQTSNFELILKESA